MSTSTSQPSADTKRKALTDKFADNQRPTGADFKEFIESSVIQGDDGIMVTPEAITFTKPLQLAAADNALGVTGDTTVQGSLQVTGTTTLQNTVIVEQETTLKADTTIEGDTALHKDLAVTGDSALTGTLKVTGNSTIEADLTVQGNSAMTGTLSAGGATQLNGPVKVGKENTTGTDKPLVHLAHIENSGEDLLKITPHGDDKAPLVVDEEANLGLGHAEPLNKLDVDGSVYIGDDTQKVEPQHSLSVQERLGVGTVAPQARVDVRTNTNETAISIRQNETSLLSVETGQDNTQAELRFSGNSTLGERLTVEGPTKLNQAATLEQSLQVRGETTLENNLKVQGNTTLDDNLTVKQDTDLEKELKVQGDTTLEQSLQVNEDTKINKGLTVQGVSKLQNKVEINTEGEEDILTINKNHTPILAIHTGASNQPASLTLSGEATIKKTLKVEQSATIEQGLSVKQDVTVEQTLRVKEQTNLAQNLAVGGDTTLDKTLRVTGNSTVQALTVEQDANLEKQLIVKGDAKYDHRVGIGIGTEGNQNPTASLHIKQDTRHTALRVENTDGKDSLNINQNKITLGATEQPIELQVTGTASISETLAVKGDTNITGNINVVGDITAQQGLSVTQGTQQNNHTALKVQASGPTNQALSVKYQQDDSNQTLIQATQTQVGILREKPETDFHVGGASRFDQAVEIQGELKVQTTDPAQQPGLHVSEGKVAIGKPITMLPNAAPAELNAAGPFPTPQQSIPTLEVQGDTRINGETQVTKTVTIGGELTVRGNQTNAGNQQIAGDSTIGGNQHITGTTDIQGDTRIQGNMDINDWVKIQPDQMTMVTTVETPILSLENTDPTRLAQTQLAAGKIGINVAKPSKALEVAGETQLDGELQVTDSLTASAEQTTVHSPTLHERAVTIQDQLSVEQGINLNKPTEQTDQTIDLHIRHSKNDSTALRIEPARGGTPSLVVQGDKIGINTDQPEQQLQVEGNTRLSEQLSVGGPTQLQDTLKVTGTTELESSLEVQGTVTADQDLTVAKNLGLTTKTPNARLHIDNTESEQVASLRIDDAIQTEGPVVMVKAGRVGIGTEQPSAKLEVSGDAKIHSSLTVGENTEIQQALTVTGRTELQDTLRVTYGTHLDGDLTVHADAHISEKLRVTEQVILGNNNHDDDEKHNPSAQLYIDNTQYNEALRIEGKGCSSLVYKNGQLGIGIDQPNNALDVSGNTQLGGSLEVSGKAEIEGELKVEDNAHFREDVTIHEDLLVKDNAEIEETLTVGRETTLKGSLTVEKDSYIQQNLNVQGKIELAQKLSVQGNTDMQGTLSVEQDSTLRKNLRVQGTTDLAQQLDVREKTKLHDTLSVRKETDIGGDLNLHGQANIHRGLQVKGGIQTGGDQTTEAYYHLRSPEQAKTPFILDQSGTDQATQRLITVQATGNVGIGTSKPQTTLDVSGNFHADHAVIDRHVHTTKLDAHEVQATHIHISDHLQLGASQTIHGIDADRELGGENTSDDQLVTQAAVKHYIDKVSTHFGQGGRTITINQQQQFDEYFNDPERPSIAYNTTIILLPLDNKDDNVGAYRLKQQIKLESGVSIIGYNPKTTIIQKQNREARFELVGRPNNPVHQVNLQGFTYDGCNLESPHNGAAFYLHHAEHSNLNCQIQHHVTGGNGGAIYAESGRGEQHTTNNIEAWHIHHCAAKGQGSYTQRNAGGAAYGLHQSRIRAYHCEAEQGGAVAYCNESTVEAYHCTASCSGGGAYRSNLLQMHARNCQVTGRNGKGGGAYYCSDLICTGQWLHNQANQGPNIYANDDKTPNDDNRYYWIGDYVGGRIERGERSWNAYNA